MHDMGNYMKKCVFCGYQLENEDKFCPQCGNKEKKQEIEGNLHKPRVEISGIYARKPRNIKYDGESKSRILWTTE